MPITIDRSKVIEAGPWSDEHEVERRRDRAAKARYAQTPKVKPSFEPALPDAAPIQVCTYSAGK